MKMEKEVMIVKLPVGGYYLNRESDNSGNQGSMLRAIDNTGKQVGENGELHIGCSVQCGSHYARTMQWQDWWLTTPITEFLEVSDENKLVKFKTKNSIYTVVVR